MRHYIKSIFKGEVDEHTHDKFIRYSKGEFVGPLIKIKVMKDKIKLNSSFHYCDELLVLISEEIGSKKCRIKGSLFWNEDLTKKLEAQGIKYIKAARSRGNYKYALDNVVKFKPFVDAMIPYKLLLSVKFGDVSLFTKNSFPKPNKEFGDNFCKVTLPVSMKDKVLREFAFDVEEDVKEVSIRHTIFIDGIEVPKVENFEEARKLAKRKGSIKREVTVKGEKTKVSVCKFVT